MTDDQLDDRLRAFFAPLAAETPSRSLVTRVDAIPARASTTGSLISSWSGRVLVLITVALLIALALSAAFIVGAIRPRPPLRTSMIAFDSGGHIFVEDGDGTDLRQLTNGPETDFSPTWSPDGSKLAFWSQLFMEPTGSGPSKTELTSLEVVDADGSHPRTVVAGLVYPDWAGPQWSPDGQWLAYASHDASATSEQPAGIAVVSLSGGDETLIVAGSDMGMNPIWSPDGDSIAYALQGALHLVAPDGTGDKVIVSDQVQSAERWAPDGSRIAYSGGSCCGGLAQDSWVVNRDGSNPHALTDLTASEVFGGWSHDGSATVISRRSADQTWVVMMADADGQHARPLAVSGVSGAAQWTTDGGLLLARTPQGFLILDAAGAKPPIAIGADNPFAVSGYLRAPSAPDLAIVPSPSRPGVTDTSPPEGFNQRATNGFSIPFTFNSDALPNLASGDQSQSEIWTQSAPSNHAYDIEAADFAIGLSAFSSASVYADPCHPSLGFANSGTTIDDLAAVLSQVPHFAVGIPRPTTIGGLSGEILDFRTTSGTACDQPNTLSLLQADPGIDDIYVLVNGPSSTSPSALAPREVQLDGSIWGRWTVLDVKDSRLLFETWTAGSPPDDVLASLDQVVSSVRFH